ncbi:MAG TPA: hypothetical protein ENK26_04595 [Gammaproteobacteria bacterium]|nr:hypothetical protein [Gammaproteobacteria bacterium]
MSLAENQPQPAWGSKLSLNVTPEGLATSLFATATETHTSWESCVLKENVLNEVTVGDDVVGNYCRLLEQEYAGERPENPPWHDWTVEIKIGEVYVTAHWQLPVNAAPFEWDWCEKEAAEAFARGCVLFGKRVHRGGLIIEEAFSPESTAKATHH